MDITPLPVLPDQKETPAPAKKRSALARLWDNDDKTEEERRFVNRLDWGLMTCLCISYFIKYLDQANVNNAYVSGMSGDLGFTGDQYNVLLTTFQVGYALGAIPGVLIMVKVSPAIFLPACEVFWTILVMACAGAKSPQTLMVLRFFIGMAEATSYPGGIWILGAWYNKHELAKRAVIFTCASAAGSMFSGYLQAAVLNLDGVNGITGWQWLFIMDGVISLPIAIWGFFMLPNTPERPNRLAKWLRPQDIAIGVERMRRINRKAPSGFSWKVAKELGSTWLPWVIIPPYITYFLAVNSYLFFNLWLKSTGLYSTYQINLIPSGGFAIQIVSGVLYCWASDYIGSRWPVILVCVTVAFIGNLILAIWPANNAAIMTAFFINYTVATTASLMNAWANELSAEMGGQHRALLIALVNVLGFVFNAWVPNFVFPASAAPHYPVGYKATSAFLAFTFFGTLLIQYLAKTKGIPKIGGEHDAHEEPEEVVLEGREEDSKA